MQISQRISGVYAAAVTPLHPNGTIQMESIPDLLRFLAQRGCHGALLFGTTGEGPSFSSEERCLAFRAAAYHRQELPGFSLLAGTGTPSLDETIQITRAAFDCGFDGVVTLPPYYYRKATEDGFFAWYGEVIRKAVPADGALLGYHIPATSGVELSLDLLGRLKDAFPNQFAGLKDSSGDADFARQLNARFGHDLVVLTGNDKLFQHALAQQASGCITAMANLFSPYLRQVWDSHKLGSPDLAAQARLVALRDVFDQYPPAAPFIKALLPRLFGLPAWQVRPPMLPLPPETLEQALEQLAAIEQAPVQS
jgi:4-hydroxy-tetrahydrodipicolinate synthase